MKQLQTMQDMAEYVQNLSAVVGHHGRNLKGWWPQVLVGLVGHADAPPVVRTFRGQLASSLWAVIGGHRYAFVGERLAAQQYAIVVKQHTVRGPEVARFTDTMSPDEIQAVFRDLKVG